jgi:hypothetical protein
VQENETAKSVKELESRIRQGHAWLLHRERRHAQALHISVVFLNREIFTSPSKGSRTETIKYPINCQRVPFSIGVKLVLTGSGSHFGVVIEYSSRAAQREILYGSNDILLTYVNLIEIRLNNMSPSRL